MRHREETLSDLPLRDTIAGKGCVYIYLRTYHFADFFLRKLERGVGGRPAE